MEKFEIQNEPILKLAIKNIIPNASAAVMRKSTTMQVDVRVNDFKVGGDWYFYLNTIKSGYLAYCPEVLNHYRRHRKSVFHKNKEKTVQETEKMHQYIIENYHVNNETIDMMKESLDLDYEYIKATFQRTLNYEAYKKKYRAEPTILVFIGEMTFGGGELFPIRLANEFARQNYKVYLLSFDRVPAVPEILDSVSKDVYLVRMADVMDHGGFEAFVRKKAISYISTHNYHAEKFMALNFNGQRPFWCVSTHGMYEHLIKTPQDDLDFSMVFSLIFKLADKIIYTADKNLEPFEHLPFSVKNKLVKINNGFRKSDVQPVDRHEYKIANDDVVIFFAARGIPEKGWTEAIAAVKLLNAGYAQRKFHIFLIGDNDYVRNLKNGENDRRIHFCGYQKNLDRFIEAADIGIVPTYFPSESQPLVIIELLAQGKPVVATDIGEISAMLFDGDIKAGELLKYSNGPVSVSELAEKIQKVMENDRIYHNYSENAKIRFREYDIENCAANYLALFPQRQ